MNNPGYVYHKDIKTVGIGYLLIDCKPVCNETGSMHLNTELNIGISVRTLFHLFNTFEEDVCRKNPDLQKHIRKDLVQFVEKLKAEVYDLYMNDLFAVRLSRASNITTMCLPLECVYDVVYRSYTMFLFHRQWLTSRVLEMLSKRVYGPIMKTINEAIEYCETNTEAISSHELQISQHEWQRTIIMINDIINDINKEDMSPKNHVGELKFRYIESVGIVKPYYKPWFKYETDCTWTNKPLKH